MKTNGNCYTKVKDVYELEEIPISGIHYKQLKVEKIPLTPEYTPLPEELVPGKNRTVVIDASRTCMPFGAMWATLGVHKGLAFVQGAQGCTTYVRYTFARIFREPAAIATASFHEDAAVFGGRSNIVKGLRNLVCRYQPALISIITTCSSEIIGDDIQNFLEEAKENMVEEFGEEVLDLVKFVIINTPSFAGSHVEGYNRAAKAYVQTLARKVSPNNKINIIPGMITPGDIREIKHILKLMELDHIMLFDISGTLDCPLRPKDMTMPYYPKGGTKVEEIMDMANSMATFALSPEAGKAGAMYLEKRYKIPAVLGPLPIGVHNTDKFVKKLKEISGKPIPEELKDERGILLDAMADTLHYTMNKRFAVCGDPDIAAAVTRFCCELGMVPVVVLSGTPSKLFEEELKAIADEYNFDPIILSDTDMFEWEEIIKKEGVDLILGHSKCVNIAKETNTPLVRIGFPVYDRVGYQRRAYVGYRGGEFLSSLIVNTILEAQFPDDRIQQ